jgi:two-component system, LytTR family, response regulator
MSEGHLRVILVDDEPVARRLLRSMLAEHPSMQVVGECRNAGEAVAAIRNLDPDVVFLDIQMPGGDGFSVIEQVGVEEMPAIVFVTAFDEYALKAFEVVAADYLLKPFDEPRLESTVSRLRGRLAREDPTVDARLVDLLKNLRGQARYIDRIAVEAGNHVAFIPTAEVAWLEAKGKSTLVHSTTETYQRREGLSELFARLDPKEFIRIHRSTVVRIDHIKEIHRWSRGGYFIVLKDGTELTTGGRYKSGVEEVLLGRQRPPG